MESKNMESKNMESIIDIEDYLTNLSKKYKKLDSECEDGLNGFNICRISDYFTIDKIIDREYRYMCILSVILEKYIELGIISGCNLGFRYIQKFSMDSYVDYTFKNLDIIEKFMILPSNENDFDIISSSYKKDGKILTIRHNIKNSIIELKLVTNFYNTNNHKYEKILNVKYGLWNNFAMDTLTTKHYTKYKELLKIDEPLQIGYLTIKSNTPCTIFIQGVYKSYPHVEIKSFELNDIIKEGFRKKIDFDINKLKNIIFPLL